MSFLRGSLKLAAAVKSCNLQQQLIKSRYLIQNQPAAFISTSKKNRDVTITADAVKEETKTATKKVPWVSFGFSWRNEEEDLNSRNMIMFFTVTFALVGGGFFLAYYPDVKLRDWCQRQAYIELARREACGLPPIDENLIPIENINLPTEEELGDFDVVV